MGCKRRGRDAGVTIFVPHHLLRDRSLTLYEVSEHQKLLKPMDHLKDWLTPGKENWGVDRFAVMFHLYVHLELALRRRYGDRLKGRISKLDHAFARCREGPNADSLVVDTTAESMKKIRQEMQRRLREYGQDDA